VKQQQQQQIGSVQDGELEELRKVNLLLKREKLILEIQMVRMKRTKMENQGDQI